MLPSGQVPPWQCYDPLTGMGIYTPITALQSGYPNALAECVDKCHYEGPPTYNCTTIPGSPIGSCWDPQDGTGTYSVEQNCIDACKNEQIDPHVGEEGYSWNCSIPWQQTVG